MKKLSLIVLFIIVSVNISLAQNRGYILDEKVSLVYKNMFFENTTANFSAICTSEECSDKDSSNIDTQSIQNIINRALQKENAGNLSMTKDTVFVNIILKTDEFEVPISLKMPLLLIPDDEIKLMNDIIFVTDDKKEKVIQIKSEKAKYIYDQIKYYRNKIINN